MYSQEEADLLKENRKLGIQRSECRMLLAKMVRHVRREHGLDGSVSSAQLVALAEQVADYLNRTHDPRDILRAPPATSDEPEAESKS